MRYDLMPLSHYCRFADDRISVSQLTTDNYISTENMLQNKAGITISTGLPTTNQTAAFKVDDILVSNIRPYFKKIWLAKFNGGCSNDVLVFRSKENCDASFMYYVLSSDTFFDYATSTAKGTKMPRGDKAAIMRFNTPKVSLQNQKAIAATLTCLDDKIELNNHINKNLEAQAQAIFKSWFVDFEPFQNEEFVESEFGNIPKGWKVSKLDKIANFTNGLAMQKYRPKENEMFFPVLKIKELRQGKTDASSELCSANISEKYIVEDGDVVFSWSGSLMVDIWCSGKVGLNQHLFKVTSNEFSKWFYYYWTCYHLNEFQAIAEAKATTMGHIKRTHLSSAMVIIPSKDNYIKIDKIMSPFIENIINNKKQNQVLSTLRDTLLPKLMSGEIQIP